MTALASTSTKGGARHGNVGHGKLQGYVWLLSKVWSSPAWKAELGGDASMAVSGRGKLAHKLWRVLFICGHDLEEGHTPWPRSLSRRAANWPAAAIGLTTVAHGGAARGGVARGTEAA